MAKRKSMAKDQWSRVAIRVAQCRALMSQLIDDLAEHQTKSDVSKLGKLIDQLGQFKLRLVALAAPDVGLSAATNIFFHECHGCPEITEADMALMAAAFDKGEFDDRPFEANR